MATVVPVRSVTGAARDVPSACSSASTCASPACSVRLGGFGKAKCGADFELVGGPCSPLSVKNGISSVRVRAEPVGLFHPLNSSFGDRHASVIRRRSSRIVTVSASVEEGVKDSGAGEITTTTSSSDSPKVEPPSPSASGAKSPFKSGGKISSIATKQTAVDSKPPGVSEESAAPRKPALVIGAREPRPAGQLSPKAADQLKVSKPASVFTQGAGTAKPASPFAQPGAAAAKPSSPFTTGAAAGGAQKPVSPFAQPGASPVRPASPFVQPGTRGKRVVDAFKDGEKEGKTTKFGQPVVPTNIFQDVRRTPEEQAADAFKFSINPGQLVLVFSFLLIIGLMVGTAALVWKLGGIHYNEY
ncbi:hypothetical protein MPTK1_5g02160 [Marchantia polymorpha subsp. ruderalis]|uniref:Uncharacterized protein n=2 Tax=Marchantia polymorpha TaxID=3197 RepID=A0A176VQ74_MARPO|nr:hypothetical protein AXG93_3509s1040 [Marchantia polymorpha subsp. ruderalis]PTQ29117.1 hypothetical protein MARPO_0147s0009 [Marchantia polymorpha]BBN10256.1 hypothetical protein Mp_5g02160 [Marchantia polymorpha subsp. ruderalis]|eukprot:PTQ29117.1 hypothetical protein MARPO_0147s0009 [Marchantia polymorpha]